MKRQVLILLALLVFATAFTIEVHARRVPCSAEDIGKIQRELSKLTLVKGDLRLLDKTAVSNGSWPYHRITGEIKAANDKRFKVSFDDVTLIGTCFDFLIPSTDVQGKFYLKQGSDGDYTLVHWEDKYLTEPTESEIEGN